MSATPPLIPNRQKWKTRHTVLLVLALFTTPFFLWLWHHASLAAKVEARWAKVRAAGEPTTLAELNVYYRPAALAENAAPVYTNAFAIVLSNKSERFLESFDQLPPGTHPLKSELREDFQRAVIENRAAFELLEAASKRSACRYPIDYTGGFDALFPHIRAVQWCAKLYVCRGVLDEESGDVGAAIGAVRAILKLGESLNSQPDMLAMLAQLKTDADAIELVRWILNHRALTFSQLSALRIDFTNDVATNSLYRGLAGERALATYLHDVPASEIKRVLEPHNEHTFVFRLGVFVMRARGMMLQDKALILDAVEALQKASCLPFPQRLDKIKELQVHYLAEAQSNRLVVAGSLLPGCFRFVNRSAEIAAGRRLVRAALAIESFRAAQGSLPTSLAALVPAYLDAVPTDPFDGEELRYRTLDIGFVVYSVGPDLVDGQGLKRISVKSPARIPAGDIAFEVVR